jgi:hypothetical protein
MIRENEKNKVPSMNLMGNESGKKITGSTLLAGARLKTTGAPKKRFFGIASGKEAAYVVVALLVIALVPWAGYYLSKKEMPVTAKRGFQSDKEQVQLAEPSIKGYGAEGMGFDEGLITAADYSRDPGDYIITKSEEEAMSLQQALLAAAGDAQKPEEPEPASAFRDSLGGFDDALRRVSSRTTGKPKVALKALRKIASAKIQEAAGGFKVGPELKGDKAKRLVARGTSIRRVKPNLSEIQSGYRLKVAKKGLYRDYKELSEAEKAKRIGGEMFDFSKIYGDSKLTADQQLGIAADVAKRAKQIEMPKAAKPKYGANPSLMTTGAVEFAPIPKPTVAFQIKKELAMARAKLKYKLEEEEFMRPYKEEEARRARREAMLGPIAEVFLGPLFSKVSNGILDFIF